MRGDKDVLINADHLRRRDAVALFEASHLAMYFSLFTSLNYQNLIDNRFAVTLMGTGELLCSCLSLLFACVGRCSFNWVNTPNDVIRRDVEEAFLAVVRISVFFSLIAGGCLLGSDGAKNQAAYIAGLVFLFLKTLYWILLRTELVAERIVKRAQYRKIFIDPCRRDLSNNSSSSEVVSHAVVHMHQSRAGYHHLPETAPISDERIIKQTFALLELTEFLGALFINMNIVMSQEASNYVLAIPLIIHAVFQGRLAFNFFDHFSHLAPTDRCELRLTTASIVASKLFALIGAVVVLAIPDWADNRRNWGLACVILSRLLYPVAPQIISMMQYTDAANVLCARRS